MRIAICDDDEQELASLLELITEYQSGRGKDVDCRSFLNSTDFLCGFKGGEYDLVLLDMPMAGADGVQAARELRELDRNVEIIFISSSPEFAVESYSVGAYYYLLKPVDADSLFPLLDSVGSRLFLRDEQGLVLRSRKGVVRVPFTRLEFVEVVNKTVSFHLSDGAVYEVTAALSDFEEKLLYRPEFFKTHRSYLINLNYIQSIGANNAVTKNGHDIPLSRQRRGRMQDAYMRFLNKAGTQILKGGGQEEARLQCSERYPECVGRSERAWRLLLVDDDMAERAYWADILRSHGCIVELAGNGGDALKLAEEESWDCVLLDVMIPGEDGFSICGKLKELTAVPVIFLSCVTEADRQLEGFTVGGIDYITKDTTPELFWAKVETRIRLSVADGSRTQARYGPLLLDLAGRRTVMDGKELPLTSDEFDILWRLSEHAGQVFSPEGVCGMIYGGRSEEAGQRVQMHMPRLRRKLIKAWGEHTFIETVWGQGYRFVPPDD